MLRHIGVLTVLFFCLPFAVVAETIHVPGDQPTIQAGIDAAVDGDTVLVADGTYTGDGNRDIEFGDKSITVKSENGPESCIIDCQGSESEPHRGFYIHGIFEEDAVLQGFTIKNGHIIDWNDYGGGIRCSGLWASLTITNNIITENTAWFGGGIACTSASESLIVNNQIIGNNGVAVGGIYCSAATPTIDNNVISDNSGSGIYIGGSGPTVTGNIITNNYDYYYAGGGISCNTSTSIIYGNIIANNSYGGEGGGISISHGSVSILNNLIMGNKALGNIIGDGSPVVGDGGGIFCISTGITTLISGNTIVNNYATRRGGGLCLDFGSRATITNTIFWNNHAPNGKEIFLAYKTRPYFGSYADISYSNVDGGPASVVVHPGCELTVGDGMIDADPLFVSGPLGDFYLSQVAAGQAEDSPCFDSGDPDSEMTWGITRTDHIHDTGVLDMGFHYPWQSVSSQLACIPASGTLPFQALFGIQLSNNYIDSDRTIAARIGISLAGGLEIPNWKSGTVTIGPDDFIASIFTSTIPMLPLVVGENTFTLVAEDVTPAPYNQPPYPPSGANDMTYCTVTGVAP